MRTYEQTHPWLRFACDLRAADPGLWMLIGETRSKCEHIAGGPSALATWRGDRSQASVNQPKPIRAGARERRAGGLSRARS